MMGRSRSRRHDSRAPPIRYQDRGYPPHIASPIPSRVPEIGLRDLTRVVTTSNRYPSAHGGSSDVWNASWTSETGVHEVYHCLPSSTERQLNRRFQVAVKAMRVPVDNPEMKRAMNNVCLFCVILSFCYALTRYVCDVISVFDSSFGSGKVWIANILFSYMASPIILGSSRPSSAPGWAVEH